MTAENTSGEFSGRKPSQSYSQSTRKYSRWIFGPNETTHAPLDRRASRLTRLYVLALSAVAALSITGQLLVQSALHRQWRDSTVVNIAGRQRMLSQKLTKAALVWSHATTGAQREERAREIAGTLALWKQSHDGLQHGDAELSLPGNLSPAVARRFADLQPTFAGMVAAADELTQSKDAVDSERLLATLLELEPRFLAAMDAVVFELDDEARARVARLQRIEWLLLLLTLLVLATEGWLVFRPAVRRIRAAAKELLESEEKLRIAKEAAESASEQKTRFLANLSHELRNPLHAILGNSELLLASALAPRERNQLTAIDDSARSLLALVNDLLDLACLQAGQLRIRLQPIDLRTAASRVLLMVRPLTERKGLKLVVDLPTGDVVAAADPLRLQQVLLNLLGNAVKFTDFGQISLQLKRSAPAAAWRIEVHDTGPGIPPELQPAIFAAFVQVDSSAKREHAGVGLGLAISSGLVALMQGRCGVQSAVGAGSCFWIELPVSDGPVPQSGKQTGLHAGDWRPALRVLVAEDDEVNRRLLNDYLQTLGHQPYLAADGQQALNLFQAKACDVVLLDWHMPQLDGLELARKIRAWEQAQGRTAVPLIAISAAGAIADEQLARQAGIDRILTKPLGLETLRAALAETSSQISSVESPLPARWSQALARMQGNVEIFRAVAEIFLAQLPAELADIEERVARRDFPPLVRSAHLLQGQAANFDAEDLVAAALELETAAAAENAELCDRACAIVQTTARDLLAELQRTIEKSRGRESLAYSDHP